MWLRRLSWCSLALLAAVSLPADMRESAWRARGMLGPARWAQVLRIGLAQRGSTPAREVYALVFELEDRLWYYADDSGTESLSTQRGRLAQDMADLGPLLKKVDPRFDRYEVLRREPGDIVTSDRAAALPQGCFIECVAYLQAMSDLGRAPDEARLVSYYRAAGGRTQGHTVLYFARQGEGFFYDPEGSQAPVPIGHEVRLEALAIARAAAPAFGYPPLERAVFLPLQVAPAKAPGRIGQDLAASRPIADERSAPVLLN
jgi:hypothetical protein